MNRKADKFFDAITLLPEDIVEEALSGAGCFHQLAGAAQRLRSRRSGQRLAAACRRLCAR